MNYLFQGFGVFLGVLAGTLITVLTHLYFNRQNEKQQLKNLKFEFELNIKKINAWLNEMVKYRNAVNGDSLQNYFGYFDLSRFVHVTADAMFTNGTLYKHLSHEDIGELQVIYSELSFGWEKMLNDEISNNRNLALTDWMRYKSSVVQNLDFWDGRFTIHKKTLETILQKIPS